MKLLLRFLYMRRLGLLLLALLGLLLFWTRPASAQQVYLRQFGPTEGFRPAFVYALLQDRQGYLWLGTGEGLIRYDGTQFITFTKEDGLAEDFVVSLREEPATGRLWVGHYQGGISVKKTAAGSFSPAKRSAVPAGLRLTADGPPRVDTAAIGHYLRRYHLRLPVGTEITCLLEDREGNAWLGTAGQGLLRHSDRHLRMEPYRVPTPSDFPVLATVLTNGIAEAWLTQYGNRFYQLRATTDVPAATGNPRVPPLPDEVKVLLPRPARLGGGFWVGTSTGLYATSNPNHLPQAIPGLSNNTNFNITALAYAPGSGLWIGTAADGIYLLPADSSLRIRHFTTANGLLHNTTYALLADRNGRVWVATHGTGIAAYDPALDEFVHYRLGSVGLDASSLAEDADGRIWVGTEGQSIYCRQRSGQWQHLAAVSQLPSDYAYGLLPLPGPAGPQLLLVHRQGLTLLDCRTRVFTPLAATDDPLVRDCLGPAALATSPGTGTIAWLSTRTGLLRVDVNAARHLVAARRPGLAITAVEIDGEPRALDALGTLSATRHRVNFTFQGISLNAGEALMYQHRLRGLADEWSHPGPAAEAQFPGLDAGQYVFEARVRRGDSGPWSPVVAATFNVATPVWRTWWFRTLALLALAGLAYGLIRFRERTLRRTQFALERAVRERTAELRQQKAHIEDINVDLMVARDAAEASRRAKAQFLANMSHEIRTPMNAVIGLTNLLQATRPNTEQAEYLTAIESSSQNLLVIINDILDSSKMEAGKLTLEQVPFRLPEAVRRLGAMFKFATESKGLFFAVNVADNVPAAVLGDPVRLNQILVNLVGNAIKFTRAGGVTVTVEVVPGPDSQIRQSTNPLIRFAVRDTGIGIPNDKLGAIFEDFSQANTSTTREFGGTGLGLSIARNLVQLHGGQLGVTSEEGQGSEFFFELPYELADASAARPDAHAGLLTPFEPALRILVAEDNALNQLVARKTLEAWNVQVVIAENGHLAVEAITGATQPFDAILMDVQMPELDGYGATREIRRHCPDAGQLPIIGLTASVLPEDRALALAAGMNDTLAKPFEPAVLYARIAHFTGRSTVGNEAATTPNEKHPRITTNPPTHQSANPPTLKPNWHLLEELAGGNESFLRQIITTFLTEAPALEALLAATYPHDPAALASTAHKLKGQVAYFGVPVLHTQLDELERAARHPALPYCEPLLHTIRQQLAELYPQLEERAGT
ncbi:hybrid sensor histidine kinase/response regulator [Hymenobacter siberiensis]|uniref:hybrid sensor histidine kinase/response regulator n=1 Tax=Hymenobacter siberiensis TaxID=2848396 RepID=UPI001C1DD06C|nr:hybrid sensor histidine kinase/response regulator [Hymenobacter siberiensis]MBU6120190.1 response regulator [Hymenobacter siberiensis]